jgi:hypothetical protein
MERQFERFLGAILDRAERKLPAGQQLRASAAGSQRRAKDEIPLEFNGKDYITFLLGVDAEIEHGLMLQYLYGAYSLGGPQVPAPFQHMVRTWQEVIMGIAKEEMGHFVSVQNVLRLIGGAMNFGRQDYPWDTPFYPFPFKLEPLTLNSLAKYVYAESPANWFLDHANDPVAIDILRRVNLQVNNPNTVGALFEVLLELIKEPTVIADEVFQANTYPFQAKFSEWGRGYAGGERGNSVGPVQSHPDVLVVAQASRDDAYDALLAISEQGEATTASANDGLSSHFERFLAIYTEWYNLERAVPIGQTLWKPARNVAVNPYVATPGSRLSWTAGAGETEDERRDPIHNPLGKLWAHLFNVRYRLLLNFLTHSYMVDDGCGHSSAHTARGALINSTFGEMYNLRAVATVLVQTPLAVGGSLMAGPTFEFPYTIILPNGEANRWRVHKDCLEAAKRIIDLLLPLYPNPADRNRQYLISLLEADQNLMKIADQLTSIPV